MRRALLILALLTVVPAYAQDDEIDCTDPQAQQHMNICAHRDYEKSDAELNAVWKDALASAREMDAEEPEEIRKGAAKALLAAQRGWLAYRDGHCELAGWEAHGGSMEPMLVSGCLAEMTRARVKALRDFISGPQQ